MTLAQITERVMALTPEQVDRECAEGPMGWRLSQKTGGYRFWHYKNGKCVPGGSLSEQGWHPSTDRNQSRMVTDKVKPLLGHEGSQFRADWFNTTHLDECRAALIAHDWAKENEKTWTKHEEKRR